MATNASRRARERRIRAKYRKKVFLAGLIMLLIGLAVGYVVSMVTAEPPAEPRVQPTPEVVYVQSEPEIVYITPDPAEVDLTTPEPVIVYVTPEPTEEVVLPTAEPVIIYVTPEPTAVPTAEPVIATPAPTAEPTQAPIVEPVEETNVLEQPLTILAATQEPVVVPATPVETQAPAAPVVAAPQSSGPVIVPYGEMMSFNTQINADGTARLTADAEAYETVNLGIKIDGHRGPTYFQSNYSDSFMLQGNEAVVEFELILNGYTGNQDIIPQNFLLVTLRGDSDAARAQGFQLMDAEIGGKYGISVYSDTPTTLYKRYPYNAQIGDMLYLVVNTYNDGVEGSYWFEIIDPNPEPPMYDDTFESLDVGSKGEEVAKLQKKLIEMDLLSDKADGKFGKKTGEAVKACQELFGFEPTGIADAKLMNALFDI